jgi:hypothetical protein
MSRSGEDRLSLEKGMESIQLGTDTSPGGMPQRSFSTPANSFSGAAGLFNPGPSNFNPEPGPSGRTTTSKTKKSKQPQQAQPDPEVMQTILSTLEDLKKEMAEIRQQRAPSRRPSPDPIARPPVAPDPVQQHYDPDDDDDDDYRQYRGRDNDRQRNPQWKTSEFGYFWPDMPASYGYGRIIDHDNARIFRDVNSFIMHIRGSVPYYGAETIRNNLPNTFKGQAFSWYNDILPDATKSLLRRDPDPTCGGWCDQLLQNFKQSGAHAMKEITSQRTNYTLQMLKRGDSIVEWFSGMISLAADADFRTDQHKLNFIYHKFDAELRKDLPQVQPMYTVQQYSQLLREYEESLRDAAREQDRRLGFQFQRYGGYNPTRGYPNSPQYQRTPRYDQYRRDRDTPSAYQDTRPSPASPTSQSTPATPERAKNSPLLLMDKEHSSPRKAPPAPNFLNYR